MPFSNAGFWPMVSCVCAAQAVGGADKILDWFKSQVRGSPGDFALYKVPINDDLHVPSPLVNLVGLPVQGLCIAPHGLP